MRLEQNFEVPVPVAQAWGVLLDVEQIAPCMPGATLTGFDGTGFTGTVKVKLGPVSLAYKGNGRFTERDEDAKRVMIVASGQDARGGGGASARITAVLHNASDGASTLVKVVADLDIAGRAAQFGRGMIADVSNKLIQQFADCLAQTISATTPAPAEAAGAPAEAPPAPAAAPPAAPAPAPAPVPASVDAVMPPAPPPLAPVFAEPSAPAPASTPPAPSYTPPAATSATPPEYHPLAMQEPPEGAAAAPAAPPAAAPVPEPEREPKPESAYAYRPEPTPTVESSMAGTPSGGSAAPAPTPAARPAPVEAEPIDLLALTGAKGMLRKAAPVLIIVALALIGLVVWLIVR